MIRAFLRFVEWLDKRFPPKVRVTKELVDLLSDQSLANSRAIQGLREVLDAQRERIAKLEKAADAIKENFTKLTDPVKVAENRRAQFIAQGRMDG